jgi:spore coat protein U-like protein
MVGRLCVLRTTVPGTFKTMNMRAWMKRSMAVFVTAASAFVLMGPQADAKQSAGTTFTVSSTVQQAATLTVQGNLAFASYDGSQNLFATTTMLLSVAGASAANPVTVAVGFIGTGTGNGVFQMSNGAHTLNYNLCQNPACTTLFASNFWGNTFNLTSPSYLYTLTGEIPSGEALPPGGTVMSQTIGAYFEY